MAIPRIIHYCWLGGKEKPQNVMKCIDSWKKYCPDYEIREWNEDNLDITANFYTKQAYDARAWGFVPDFLRLWIIYTYGGIYLDTDVQIVRSFDPLLNYPAFAGFEKGTADERGNYVNFGQGFGAEAGNEVIGSHMKIYNDLMYRLPDGSFNRIASPHYTTDILEKYGLNRKENKVQNLGEIVVFPNDYFCPKSFATGMIQKTSNTFSIHQFDGSWYSEEEQEQRRQWEKAARRDYWLHLPNRLARKILGERNIDKIKEYLGKK